MKKVKGKSGPFYKVCKCPAKCLVGCARIRRILSPEELTIYNGTHVSINKYYRLQDKSVGAEEWARCYPLRTTVLSRPSSSPFGKHKLEKEIGRGEIYPLSRSRTINLILALLTLDEDMS